MITTKYLICLAVIQQTIEMFFVPNWHWKTIKSEMPRILHPFLRNMHVLFLCRLVAAVLFLFVTHPFMILILLFTTWCISVRWRGTFNGGSDAMTFHVLFALLIYSLSPAWEEFAIYYITAQLVLSYFIAGISKIANSEWRSGHALKLFLSDASINVPANASQVISIFIITFEMLFPLALLFPVPFVLAGLLFHLVIAYIFGLNRFFFAWLAAYPALFAI